MLLSSVASLHLVFFTILVIWPCQLAVATRMGEQLRGNVSSSSSSRSSGCNALAADESFDFNQFKQIFQHHINAAGNMYSGWLASWYESWHLNTHLLENDVAPAGLWLKFGVDMSCDRGSCDKIGPLAEHAATKAGTKVYAFDWFKGLPEQWRDGHPQGEFTRREIPTPPKGVQWVKGIYQDSLPQFLTAHPGEKIGYLLIDSDLCSSAEFVLDQTYPHLAENAVIYFDEIMNFQDYESGELLAFYRFLKKNHLDYNVVMSSSRCNLHPSTPFFEYPYDQQAAFRLKHVTK